MVFPRSIYSCDLPLTLFTNERLLTIWIILTVHTWSIFYYIIKQQPISDCSLIELIDMHLLSCILHKSFLFLYVLIVFIVRGTFELDVIVM